MTLPDLRFSATVGERSNNTANAGPEAITDDLTLLGRRTAGMVSIESYGASTSASAAANTTAIHNAIADLTANQHVLYIPPGEFTCNAITINKAIRIVGSGLGSSLKASAATAGVFITVEAATPASIMHFGARDIKIDISAAGLSATGLKLIRTIEPELYRVTVQGNNNHTTGDQTAITMDGTDFWAGGLRMLNCRTHGTKYGVRLTNTTTSAHMVSNWILGCSTAQAGSIGVYCDATSGQGWALGFNEIESWGTGVHDLGTTMMAFGNRFESSTITFYLGGNYHQLFGNSNSHLISRDPAITTGLEWNADGSLYASRGTYGADTEPQINLKNAKADNGPSVNLFNIYEAASVALALKALGRNSTDLFSEALTAAATNIASQFRMKIGSTSTVDVELLRNNAKAIALVSGGVELPGGNVYLGSSGNSAPGIVTGVADPTSGSGVNRGLGTLYVCKQTDLVYDDFETGALSSGWTSVTGTPTVGTWATLGISAPTTGGGSYGLQLPVDSRLRKTLSVAEVWLEMRVRSGAEEDKEHFLCYLYDGTNWNKLTFTDTDVLNPPKIRFYNNAATANYDGTTTITTSTWYRVVVRFVKDGAAGVVQVWLDGNLEIDQSGLNTGADNLTSIYVGNTSAEQVMYHDYVRILTSNPSSSSGLVYVKTGMGPTDWTKLNP